MHRVTVAVDPPYDVVVGPGAVTELRAVVAPYRRTVVVSQARILDEHRSALGDALGDDPWIVTIGRRRGREVARDRRGALRRARARWSPPRRSRRGLRRGRRGRHRGLRGRGVPPRRRGRPGSDDGARARSTRRSAARRRSTSPRARTSSARSTSRSRCSPTPTVLATPARRGVPLRSRRGRQVRGHARGRWRRRRSCACTPIACSLVTPPCSPTSSRRARRSRPRWSPKTPRSASGPRAGRRCRTRVAQLRAHVRARTRDRPAATRSRTARRSPSG